MCVVIIIILCLLLHWSAGAELFPASSTNWPGVLHFKEILTLVYSLNPTFLITECTLQSPGKSPLQACAYCACTDSQDIPFTWKITPCHLWLKSAAITLAWLFPTFVWFPLFLAAINILVWEYRCNFFKDEFLFLFHVSCFWNYFWEGMCQQILVLLCEKRIIIVFSFLNTNFGYHFTIYLLFTKMFNKENLYISRLYLLTLHRCVLFYILFDLHFFLMVSWCCWVTSS